jgi:hypothetical protein
MRKILSAVAREVPRQPLRHLAKPTKLLHFAFVAAPVIAGIDKFLHLPVNWDMYLAPVITKLVRWAGTD